MEPAPVARGGTEKSPAEPKGQDVTESNVTNHSPTSVTEAENATAETADSNFGYLLVGQSTMSPECLVERAFTNVSSVSLHTMTNQDG